MIGCTLTDARVSGDFGPWRSWKYGLTHDASEAVSYPRFTTDASRIV
jgi:hypothetical protein